jgi:hypothetical protein
MKGLNVASAKLKVLCLLASSFSLLASLALAQHTGTVAKRAATAKVPQRSPITKLAIITTSLPRQTVGDSCNVQLHATGGAGGYTWSLTSGSLPPGLAWTAITAQISGTPTTAGNYSFSVTVTDAASKTASVTYSGAVATPLVITTTSLPAATVGQPYSASLGASGGWPPVTWQMVSGSLPPGLTLSAATGMISGTILDPPGMLLTVAAIPARQSSAGGPHAGPSSARPATLQSGARTLPAQAGRDHKPRSTDR